MASVNFKGNLVNTIGDLPAIGSNAPDFTLVSAKLENVKLSDFANNNVILNIFPSIDTGICATSVREFNKQAASLTNTKVLAISKDLPFALGRFCGAEGIDNVITLSAFRNQNFGQEYGVQLIDGVLAGLFTRAVIVINQQGKIIYQQVVSEITNEPDYASAIAAIK